MKKCLNNFLCYKNQRWKKLVLAKFSARKIKFSAVKIKLVLKIFLALKNIFSARKNSIFANPYPRRNSRHRIRSTSERPLVHTSIVPNIGQPIQQVLHAPKNSIFRPIFNSQTLDHRNVHVAGFVRVRHNPVAFFRQRRHRAWVFFQYN